MASGDTLVVFGPYDNVPPATNFATLDVLATTLHPVLDFDGTAATGEQAVFHGVMPQNYAAGNITVIVFYTSKGTTNAVEWEVAFERHQANTTDLDVDNFATAQAFTADTVPGTLGVLTTHSLTVTAGANTDNVAAGDSFRLKIQRDSTNDTNNDDAELHRVELQEA